MSLSTSLPHPLVDVPEGKLESKNGLQAQFVADFSPHKVDLTCGVYRDGKGGPFVLPSVLQAKKKIFEDQTWHHEYPASQIGSHAFRRSTTEIFFGKDHPLITSNRIASMQTIGASGACHMGALFLKQHYGPWKTLSSDEPRTVYVPAESWTNHPNVFSHLALNPVLIPYFSHDSLALDFPLLLTTISSFPPQSIILLQPCAHNPTGSDPTPEQWFLLAQAFRASNHFAFFDAAYMGFSSGDIFTDCAPIRVFASEKVSMLVAMTWGKAFGLYSERVGALMVILPESKGLVGRVESQMKRMARAETGAMPDFGARIVELVLGDAQLKKMWEDDVKSMAEELRERRRRLREKLEELSTGARCWKHITEQVGMFSCLGLSAEQIKRLREDHSVYILDSDRVSIAGLNYSNIEHVARSISEVIEETS